ncbi:MAG: DUF1800 domain-containing protein, partial [Deltaproteobacteria bacterium]|nr:DUF1800 domain-containing protein [Deltaproteobacteria bacterium]
MVTWDAENAAHLLSRAGFGGDERDVEKYVRYGQATAVEKLVTVKGTGAKGPGKSGSAATDPEDLAALRTWWAKRMVKATTRRLQEKMCLFWHDHFACSVSIVKNNLWMSRQNALFRRHGLVDFKTLLFEVTRDPAMLEFLDGNRNKVGKPNENYGREVMELFALGVNDLNGMPNYSQTDVQEMARALTGFVIEDDAGVFDPTRFDGGSKTVLGVTGNLGVVDASGTLLPPATNVLDVLFARTDSDGALTMPRFLAKKLWEYFAYPSPTKTRIDEVTGPFITGGFVIRDLLRSIFLHDDFYSDAAKSQTVKNPCEFAFHAIRATRASTNAKTLPDHLGDMGMNLFEPPGVNGWNNGLAWLSSGQFLARFEFAQTLAAGRSGDLKLTPTKLFDRSATSAAPVVDELL